MKCKHCNGTGKVPAIDVHGTTIIPLIMETCIFCDNGEIHEPAEENLEENLEEKSRPNNTLLDWVFNIWKNCNPFE